MEIEKSYRPEKYLFFSFRFKTLLLTAVYLLLTTLVSTAQEHAVWNKVDITDNFNFAKRPVHSVGTRTEFFNVLGIIKPGEVILIRKGTYTDWGKISISRSGSANDRIVIAAESPGSVVFRGTLNLNIGADNITLYGLSFTEVNRSDNPGSLIYITGNNVRVSGCNFISCVGPVDDHGYQIFATGDSSRIDHCYFYDMMSRGIKIRYRDEMYWKGMRGNYLIDHNIFRDMRNARKQVIQGESIYMGSGAEELAVLQTGAIVEYNLFHYAEGDKHGEIVSDKASANIYRYNMFAYGNCYLSLRHGTSKLVYGNVFYNLPAGLNPINKNHLVCNNYFLKCGTAIRMFTGNESEIIPMKSTTWAGYGSQYGNTANGLFANNTITSCENGIGYLKRGPYPTENNTVINNIFSVITGVAISTSISADTNRIDNNLFNQCVTVGSGGSNPIMLDPQFNTDKLPKLTGSSPVLNSAKKDEVLPEGFFGNIKGVETQVMNLGVLAYGLYGFDYEKIPHIPADLDAVRNKPLKAVIQILTDDLKPFQPVLIDGGASCGNITEYHWDLGKGVVVKTADSVINVLWEGDSKQSVTLTVVDGSGKTNLATVVLNEASMKTALYK